MLEIWWKFIEAWSMSENIPTIKIVPTLQMRDFEAAKELYSSECIGAESATTKLLLAIGQEFYVEFCQTMLSVNITIHHLCYVDKSFVNWFKKAG